MKKKLHSYVDSIDYKIPDRESRVVNMFLNQHHTGSAVIALNRNIESKELLEAHRNRNCVHRIPVMVHLYSDGSVEVEVL